MSSILLFIDWSNNIVLSVGLDPRFQTHVCIFRPFFFFFSTWTVTSQEFTMQGTKNIVHALFMLYSRTVHESHNTIHTFKNYFATVFSVFNFNKNKLYPNRPLIISEWCKGNKCDPIPWIHLLLLFWNVHFFLLFSFFFFFV